MFTSTRLSNVPLGEKYINFRLWLLRQVGVASAGFWMIDGKSLVFIHHADIDQFMRYVNGALRSYRIARCIDDITELIYSSK